MVWTFASPRKDSPYPKKEERERSYKYKRGVHT
jgi:hypothetical protein